ncbi:MAG: monofunctional biosynthetic peptidoglycan transglycosylase [Desulfovibrionaceae bacterium]|nr:monofunctional biosynthetic peptidoglycan transglycosylase [Desulfovibrionaceae bacterium]
MKQWKDADENKTIKQTWKTLEQISRHLQKAVVLSEDSAFWKHKGFDLERLRVVLGAALTSGSLGMGGSTITQQLAKNLYFQPDRSVARKLLEALVTWRLERNLSKDRILEIYLNVVEWGDGIFGAEAAARHYFGVPATRLSREQAAVLAAMLPNPLNRSPDAPIVKKNSRLLLARMQREAYPW